MNRSNREIFNEIYKYHIWVFGSGIGSIYSLNKPFVTYINNFLETHKDIKTVVDLGCGDWQIGSHFVLGNRRYIGCDVSDQVIRKVKEEYSSEKVTFRVLDITKDSPPKGDLVIIKDVLQHLSNQNITKVLSKLKEYKYVIIGSSIFLGKFINRDINNGRYRPLDITSSPFEPGRYKLVEVYENGLYKFVNIFRRLIFLPRLMQGIFINS